MATQFDNLQIADTTEEQAFSARELSVLIDIATVVSAASSIGAVYSSLAALVADLIEWDAIIITTSEDDGRTFTVSLREGEGVPGRAIGTKIGADGTLHGEATKGRETLYFTADDGLTAELALRFPGLRHKLLAGFRSFLASPLFSQGEVVGVICVQSFEPHAFGDHDRMLFERIAVFVGPAVGRIDAYRALKREDLRNKSLLKIDRLLLGAHDIGDVFEQFVEELRTVVEVDRIVIAITQPDGAALIDRYRHGISVPNWDENIVIPMDALEPNGMDVTSHGYILPHDAMRDIDPAASPGLYASYQAGLRSKMFVGLRSEGRLVGAVTLKSVNASAYGAADLEYFEQVADHIAASIERTLAHESEIEMNRGQEDRIRFQQEERRAVDVIRAKQRLLSSASLELRTPLSGIMGFVDLLARNRHRNLDEKQVRYLSIIRRSAEELSGKVDSLIDHAEIKESQLQISLESFEMATMLREAVTDAVPKLTEQGQSAHVESDEGIEIIGDRRQLITAIEHLIDCTSRHAPPDTTIRVLGQRVGSRIELSVICHGPGDPDEFVPEAIEPLEGEDKVDNVGRTGPDPDFTYVRAVAVAHGGDTTYDSTPDGGATFTIRIPARADFPAGL